MVQEQAAEMAALEHQLVMRSWLGAALASAGLAALIYGRRSRRRKLDDPMALTDT